MQVVKIILVLFIYSVGVPLDNDFCSNTHLGIQKYFHPHRQPLLYDVLLLNDILQFWNKLNCILLNIKWTPVSTKAVLPSSMSGQFLITAGILPSINVMLDMM
jgi:hypothetical protein